MKEMGLSRPKVDVARVAETDLWRLPVATTARWSETASRMANGDLGISTICCQSMEWTGSIRWIHNPVQSRRIWIGLDQKFTNSADSGLDWIEKFAVCIPYLEI